MTVQEIFNSTAVRSVEEEILNLCYETERKKTCVFPFLKVGL